MQPNDQMQPNPGMYSVPTPPAGMYAQNNIQPSNQQLPPGKPKSSLKLILSLVVIIILFIVALVFGLWAYSQMLDYKNNSDKKAAAAVKVANEKQKQELQAEFAEQEKSPYKSYTSPSENGSIKLVYPKTWSAYVAEGTDGENPLDAYFSQNYVPSTDDTKNSYYLRAELLNTSYKTVVDSLNTLTKQGKITVTAYQPEQVKDAKPGVRADGQVADGKKGAMIIVPLREKTLKIWTENESAVKDFNETVLKNLTYVP